MKNESLYHKTVDILVQAYFDDTLEHSSCAACAVGNIVAANLGYSFTRGIFNDLNWKEAPVFNEHGYATNWFQVIGNRKTPTERQLKEITSTGYSIEELRIIEKAFESVKACLNTDKRRFNGLMAVIEVLDQIHQNTDTVITETSKIKFNKAENV